MLVTASIVSILSALDDSQVNSSNINGMNTYRKGTSINTETYTAPIADITNDPILEATVPLPKWAHKHTSV